MPEQRNIETGVDKLVDIINRKKKVPLDDAAKELGVSSEVVQEWADFLEEEGLISIDDKLNKTMLCERRLNRGEVEKKAKEYSSKKDAFTRKVETALSSLQKESEGLDQIKSEFEKLKAAIGSDIDEVRGELQELKHYDDLKKNMDKEIVQQRLDYQAMIEGVHKKIEEERKYYSGFTDSITKEKARIEESKVELSFLAKKQDNLQKRMDALSEILRSIEKEIGRQNGVIKDATARIDAQAKSASTIQKDIGGRIEKAIVPVMKKVKENEDKILSVQNSVLQKVAASNKDIEKYKLQSVEAANKFRSFFDRKLKVEDTIISLQKEKKELEQAFQELMKKATAFNLSIKSSDVKDYVKELEISFQKIEKRKGGFLAKLSELTELINKKD